MKNIAINSIAILKSTLVKLIGPLLNSNVSITIRMAISNIRGMVSKDVVPLIPGPDPEFSEFSTINSNLKERVAITIAIIAIPNNLLFLLLSSNFILLPPH